MIGQGTEAAKKFGAQKKKNIDALLSSAKAVVEKESPNVAEFDFSKYASEEVFLSSWRQLSDRFPGRYIKVTEAERRIATLCTSTHGSNAIFLEVPDIYCLGMEDVWAIQRGRVEVEVLFPTKFNSSLNLDEYNVKYTDVGDGLESPIINSNGYVFPILNPSLIDWLQTNYGEAYQKASDHLFPPIEDSPKKDKKKMIASLFTKKPMTPSPKKKSPPSTPSPKKTSPKKTSPKKSSPKKSSPKKSPNKKVVSPCASNKGNAEACKASGCVAANTKNGIVCRSRPTKKSSQIPQAQFVEPIGSNPSNLPEAFAMPSQSYYPMANFVMPVNSNPSNLPQAVATPIPGKYTMQALKVSRR